MKQKVRIENWFVGEDDRLIGKVYGHPIFPDGTEVITSRVVTFDRETNKVLTRNTEYELGQRLHIDQNGAPEVDL